MDPSTLHNMPVLTEALASTVTGDRYKESLGFPDSRSGGNGSNLSSLWLTLFTLKSDIPLPSYL